MFSEAFAAVAVQIPAAQVTRLVAAVVMVRAAWPIPGTPSRVTARVLLSTLSFPGLSHHLLTGEFEQLFHLGADDAVGAGELGGVEIGAQLAEDVLAAGFLEVGLDDRHRVFLGLVGAEAQFLRRPQAQKLVAARHDLEAQLLVMGPFALETPLAILEGVGHVTTP